MSTYINKIGRVHGEPRAVDLAQYEAPRAKKVMPYRQYDEADWPLCNELPIVRETLEAIGLAPKPEQHIILRLSKAEARTLREVLHHWQMMDAEEHIASGPTQALLDWIISHLRDRG